MSNRIKPATIEEVRKIAEEVKKMADEVTKETNDRMIQLKIEAKEYVRQEMLKSQPIGRKIFK